MSSSPALWLSMGWLKESGLMFWGCTFCVYPTHWVGRNREGYCLLWLVGCWVLKYSKWKENVKFHLLFPVSAWTEALTRPHLSAWLTFLTLPLLLPSPTVATKRMLFLRLWLNHGSAPRRNGTLHRMSLNVSAKHFFNSPNIYPVPNMDQALHKALGIQWEIWHSPNRRGTCRLMRRKQTISVLVCSGRHNKVPHGWWLMNSRHLFLTVLEVGSPVSGCWHLVSLQTSYCIFTWQQGLGSAVGSLLEGVHTHDLITSKDSTS